MSINPIMSIFLSLLALLLYLYFLYARLCSRRDPAAKGRTLIKGSIVLMKKRVLDLTDLRSSIVDRIYELIGWGVSFQLVSATAVDSNDKVKGKLGQPAYLEGWVTKLTSLDAGDVRYNITFDWQKDQGIPGAVIVKNNHRYEFELKTLTLEGVPGKGRIHFVCNSWVYPVNKYSYDRIFFANDTYLPSNTPEPLRAYREDELRNLQGSGKETTFQEQDRIYDYDCYNDLGDEKNKRPVLGGSEESPYPRRGKTGLPGMKRSYLPRDEYFRHLKRSDFFAYKFKSDIKTWILSRGGNEFRSFKDVKKLYGQIWFAGLISWLAYLIPFEIIRELLRTDGEPLLKFPIPQVIKNDDDKTAWWVTDKEFARQMLAGLNPVLLRVAKDEEIHDFYDNKKEKCMEQKVKVHVGEGNDRRFFVLDHSYIKKYQDNIYASTKTRVSASKTILYLEEDGTLTPEGILLIDKTEDDKYKEKYYFPAKNGIEGGLWKLAKAFVIVNDSGYHQLVSHWLYTHAVIEPFVIATQRRLSVMHPIHKLLSPHFRDTMNMNNLARDKLINADGVIEKTFFPGSFAMKMTSDIYRNWNLMDHALPTDLIKRGVAVEVNEDEDAKEDNKNKDDKEHKDVKRNIRLLIKDYPYAVDGLEVWSEIRRWVRNYCSIYYDDAAVQADTELQQWWTEVREKGHGDLKDKKWWPTMQSKKDLIECCTIVIWLASAFHAAVNFGQYAYAGYVPNRPTFIRNPMPTTVEEEKEMRKDPEGYFLKTITGKPQALEIMSVIQILSRHSSEEIYLGQRDDDPMWTSDQKARVAFNEFQSRLKEIVEVNIENRNWDESLKNRHGEVKIPYTLLYPNTSGKCVPGLDGKGIPNSVSI